MRKLTRKQILARLFVGFFTLGSLLCTVNSAVAGGDILGKFKINDGSETTFTRDSDPIKPPLGSGNSVVVNIYGGIEGPTPYIYGGEVSEGNISNNSVKITTEENSTTKLSNVYGGNVGGTGSATLNEVHIASSTVNSYVYGGYVYSGSATLNEVHIASSTVNTVYGGYVNQSGSSATENKVHITDSKVNSYVYGGFVGSESSSATLNEVHIASSTVNAVAGGWAVGASSATENKVDIASSTVANVFGGYSQNGNAESNTVEIRDNSKTTNVYGGRSSNGNADSNEVKITNSSVALTVNGGNAGTGNATLNKVDISSSTVTDSVYGGKVGTDTTGNGNAVSNTITIKDSDVSVSTIYGGYTYNGDANSNKVEITNSKTATVWGGYITSESATGNTNSNTLKLTNCEINAGNIVAAENNGTGDGVENTVEVSGGIIKIDLISGAQLRSGDAILNKVTISDLDSPATYTYIIGGTVTNGNAYSNAVTLDNIEKLDVYWVAGGQTKSGEAASNTVTIKNSNIKGLLPDRPDNYVVLGGGVTTGDAKQNEVTISGSTVNGNVYGGFTTSGYADENIIKINDGSTVTGDVSSGYVYGDGYATGNTFEISGGSTVNGMVFGGYVNNDGNVTDNTVVISGDSKLTGGVIGGVSSLSGDAKGNTVEISDGAIVSGGINGGYSTSGDATENTVKINGCKTTDGSIFGAWALRGNATDNKIEISGGSSVENIVYGGYIEGDGDATGNTVEISDGSTVTYDVYGGYVCGNGNATGNKIEISGGSTVNSWVYGGNVDADGNVTDNTVEISGGSTVNSSVFGGYVGGDGNATDNTVEISGGSTVSGDVYGGNVDAVTGNKLIISGVGNKIGGSVENFESVSFKLASDDDTTKPMLSIGDSMDLDQIKLNSELPEGGFNGERTLIDGNTLNYATAVYTINGTAVDGEKSLTVAQKNEGSVNVGVYKYDLTESAIKLNAESTVAAVFQQTGKDPLSTDDRKIVVTNEMAKNYSRIYGAFNADGGDATGATVELSEAVSNENLTIYGGYSTGSGADVTTGNVLNVSKNGNKVKNILNFSTLDFTLGSDIAAGTTMLSTVDKVALGGASVNTEMSGIALAKGEKIVLLDNADKGNAELKLNGSTGDQTVAEENSSFVAVSSVGYNTNDNKIAIECKDAFAAGCYIDEKGKLGKDTLTLGSSAASNMRAGYERASEAAPDMSKYSDIYGVYSAGSANPTGATIEIVSAIDYSNTVLHGGYKAAERAFYADGNTLRVKSLNSKVKGVTDFETMEFDLPAETKSGDTMLKVTDEVDMAPTKSVGVEASKATGLKAGDSVNLIDSDAGIKNFGTQKVTVSGLTDKTGEVKVDDKALVLALDKNGEKPNKNTKAPVEAVSATMALVNQASALASSKLNKSMIAAVASANGGSATFASMNGGHSKYETGSYVEADSWNIGFGLAKKGMSSKNPDSTYGLFFQYGKSSFDTHNDGGFRGDGDSKMFGAGLTFHQEARSKYYYHGNVFAGKVDAKWNCKDGGYDDKATYYGMTFGMGRKHNAGGNKTMDIYGRYSFNHVGSMNGDLNGLKYDFDSTSSHNLRLGLRMEYSQKNAAKAYWGLAWEHEFAGDSKATVATLGRTDSPTLNGNTGIAEVGYEWKRGNWEYNINAEGSFGKREGVTGSFNINYNF